MFARPRTRRTDLWAWLAGNLQRHHVARRRGLAKAYHGLTGIRHKASAPPGRLRTEGGGRKSRACQDPSLVVDLESLVEPATRGVPMQPLLWTTHSLRD